MENFGLFDKWSKQHFMVGAVVGGFGLINVWQYIILHSLFEVWENTIGIAEWQRLGWKKYDGDSTLNIIGDTISGTAGNSRFGINGERRRYYKWHSRIFYYR